MNLKTLAHIRLPKTIRCEWTQIVPIGLWGFSNLTHSFLYVSEEHQVRKILTIKPIIVSSGYRHKTKRTYIRKLSENNFELRYKRLRVLNEKIRIENRNY